MANNRNIFIINPKFQYKLTLIICSLVFLGSIIYPWTLYDLIGQLIVMQPEAAEQYSQTRISLLTALAVAELAILGLVFVISIFLSHKIAGPMFKLTSSLKGIREGNQIKDISFRDGDHFQEVADEVNLTLQFLKEKHIDDFEYLNEVAAYIQNISLVVPEDKKPVLNEIESKLLEIRSRYREE